MQRLIPWQQAWEHAAAGFYREQSPTQHFATDAMDGTSATLVLPLLHQQLRTTSDSVTIVDVGAGDGSLSAQLIMALDGTDLQGRVQAVCLDLRDRPAGLDPRIDWIRADARTASLDTFDGILIAHELLDDLPCPWIECDAEGIRRAVLVDEGGHTHLGPALADQSACADLGINAPAIDAWLDRWWPLKHPFARCEAGLTRDAAWARLTQSVRNGHAIAVDYGHLRSDRIAGTWDGGTITGYRHGRVVSPNPDGSCNITAHVGIDAVASAGACARDTSLQHLHGDFWCLVQSFGS